MSGNLFKEAVVKLNEQAGEDAHLRCIECCRGMFDDALESGNPRLALFIVAGLLGFVLFVMTVEPCFALLLGPCTPPMLLVLGLSLRCWARALI